MSGALSYELHKLTARLDRAAEALLQGAEGISYSRFLTRFAVRENGGSQRELAQWLGLTEPTTSRMVGVLVRDGLLAVSRSPETGNQRRVSLTGRGSAVVDRCSRLLDDRFTQLVKASGVAHADFQRDTRRLLEQLENEQTRRTNGSLEPAR
jgi:DNA-binding MarR family transcriptional regulator